ncbi:MAG: hypothetical protein BIFFINMI_04065 [Phycisphaerae bacterium]|nr:hypothetical protein [Phycisphaerae bacterium]
MSAKQWVVAVAATWLACLALIGCVQPETYRAMIQSEDALKRAKGCRIAGEYRDKKCIPLLVDRLEDRDRAVRQMARSALREVTGRDIGYSETDPPGVQAEAIRKWRDYARRFEQPSGGK